MTFPVIYGPAFRRELYSPDITATRNGLQPIPFQYLELISPGQYRSQPGQEKNTHQINTKSDPLFLPDLHGKTMICSGDGCLSPSFWIAMASSFFVDF